VGSPAFYEGLKFAEALEADGYRVIPCLPLAVDEDAKARHKQATASVKAAVLKRIIEAPETPEPGASAEIVAASEERARVLKALALTEMPAEKSPGFMALKWFVCGQGQRQLPLAEAVLADDGALRALDCDLEQYGFVKLGAAPGSPWRFDVRELRSPVDVQHHLWRRALVIDGLTAAGTNPGAIKAGTFTFNWKSLGAFVAWAHTNSTQLQSLLGIQAPTTHKGIVRAFGTLLSRAGARAEKDNRPRGGRRLYRAVVPEHLLETIERRAAVRRAEAAEPLVPIDHSIRTSGSSLGAAGDGSPAEGVAP